MGRLQLRQRVAAQQRDEVLGDKLAVALVCPGSHLSPHVIQPAREEGADCLPGWIDRAAALQFGDQTRSRDLRLPLRSGEGMPTASALAGLRITDIEDDGPMAGRAFAQMSFHGVFSLPK